MASGWLAGVAAVPGSARCADQAQVCATSVRPVTWGCAAPTPRISVSRPPSWEAVRALSVLSLFARQDVICRLRAPCCWCDVSATLICVPCRWCPLPLWLPLRSCCRLGRPARFSQGIALCLFGFTGFLEPKDWGISLMLEDPRPVFTRIALLSDSLSFWVQFCWLLFPLAHGALFSPLTRGHCYWRIKAENTPELIWIWGTN